MGTMAAANEILTFSDEGEVGGQTFAGFPGDDAAVATAWAAVWAALVGDLIAPAIAAPPSASESTWQATMEPLVAVPNGGIAALSAAAVASFPLLAAAIAPNLIVLPPPAPLDALLTPALAPFIAGSTDPIAPANATAGALAAWVITATWTAPGPPAPLPFQVAP